MGRDVELCTLVLVLGVCMLRFYPYNAMKQFGAARPVTGGPRRLGADPWDRLRVAGPGLRIDPIIICTVHPYLHVSPGSKTPGGAGTNTRDGLGTVSTLGPVKNSKTTWQDRAPRVTPMGRHRPRPSSRGGSH